MVAELIECVVVDVLPGAVDGDTVVTQELVVRLKDGTLLHAFDYCDLKATTALNGASVYGEFGLLEFKVSGNPSKDDSIVRQPLVGRYRVQVSGRLRKTLSVCHIETRYGTLPLAQSSVREYLDGDWIKVEGRLDVKSIGPK